MFHPYPFNLQNQEYAPMKHMETSNGLRHASVAAILIGSLMVLHGTTTEAKPLTAVNSDSPSVSFASRLAEGGYDIWVVSLRGSLYGQSNSPTSALAFGRPMPPCLFVEDIAKPHKRQISDDWQTCY